MAGQDAITKATVEAIYASFLIGDVPAILEKTDDSAHWNWDVPLEAGPYAGVYHGKGVADFFSKLAAVETTTKFEIRQLLVSGHEAIAIIDYGLVTIPANKPFECTIIHTWTVNSEGKVTNYINYTSDTAGLIAARQA